MLEIKEYASVDSEQRIVCNSLSYCFEHRRLQKFNKLYVNVPRGFRFTTSANNTLV